MAIKVTSTIKPQIENAFPVVEAEDVDVSGKRLPEVLNGLVGQDTIDNINVQLNNKADKADVQDLGLVVQNGMLCVKFESEV